MRVCTGASAVCISSDCMFVLMHYVWGGQAPCNIQQAREGRRWGQHSLEPKTPSPPSVWVLSELAGGSTHLESTSGRPLTQLPFFEQNTLLRTHNNPPQHSGAPSHTTTTTSFLAKTHTQDYTHTHCVYAFCSGTSFQLSPKVSRTHTYVHMHAHNCSLFVLP